MDRAKLKEKRKQPRASLFLPVQLHVDSAGKLTNYVTRNISAGGMFIETDSPLPVGTTASLVLHVTSLDMHLDVDGWVVRSVCEPTASETSPGMAIQFGGDALIDGKFLKQLVEG